MAKGDDDLLDRVAETDADLKKDKSKRPPLQRKTSPSSSGSSTSAGSKLTKIQLKKALLSLVGTVAVGVSVFDPFDGTTIAENAEQLVDAWLTLAAEQPTVDRVLRAVVTGSAWGSALTATGTIAIPILIHHGAIPDLFGMGVEAKPPKPKRKVSGSDVGSRPASKRKPKADVADDVDVPAPGDGGDQAPGPAAQSV